MSNHYGFENKVALVTGGASGIGAATVERSRAGGAEVHVFDSATGDDVRDSAQLDAAIDRLPSSSALPASAATRSPPRRSRTTSGSTCTQSTSTASSTRTVPHCRR